MIASPVIFDIDNSQSVTQDSGHPEVGYLGFAILSLSAKLSLRLSFDSAKLWDFAQSTEFG